MTGANPLHPIPLDEDGAIDRLRFVFKHIRLGLPVSVSDSENVISKLHWLFDLLLRCENHVLSHRNSLLPVNRLPNEILVRIFEICGPLSAHSSNKYCRVSKNSLAFSQVCRLWRTLALSAPSLWAAPIFGRRNLQLAHEMIRRAGLSALRLSIFVTKDNVDAMKLTLRNMERVHSLSLTGHGRAIYDLLLWCTHPAPALEELRVTLEPGQNPTFLNAPMFHSWLFAGDMPCLRTLELVNCIVDLGGSSPLIPNLTTILIELSFDSRISPGDLVTLFQHGTMLENITLYHVYDRWGHIGQDQLPQSPVKMHHVKNLRIFGSLDPLIILLGCLALPKDALIDIGNDWESTVSPDSLPRLLQYFSRLYTPPGWYLRKMTVDSDDGGQIILRGWTEDDNIRLSVQLYFDYHFASPFQSILMYMAQHTPLQHLNEMKIIHRGGSVDATSDTFATFFVALHQVHTLLVHGPSAIAAIEAVYSTPALRNGQAMTDLRWIVLEKVDLCSIPGTADELAAHEARAAMRAEIMADLSSLMPYEVNLPQHPSAYEKPRNFFDKLVLFAQAKSAAGYPLRLSLNRCKIPSGAEEMYPNLVTTRPIYMTGPIEKDGVTAE